MDYTQIPLSAKPSPQDERDYPLAKLTATPQSFPDEFIIPYSHEIKNQGNVGSCVAHSLTYCREMVEEKQSGAYTQFSVGFVYANRLDSDTQTSGMFPREALQHLTNEGICSYNLFPVNEEYPGIKSLFDPKKETLLQDALPHKITAYARLYSDDDIRSALMQLGPVSACIKIAPSFYQISRSNPVMPYYTSTEALLGYHEITLVGFTIRNGKPCYKALNSWGKEWGEDGYFYIPFDLSMVEAWSITDQIIPEGEKMSTPYDRTIQSIVIHHMGDSLSPDVSILNRWNPYGYDYPEYDFGIEADGTIRQGRPLNVIGAHCRSDKPPYSQRGSFWFNQHSIGIGLAGDFTKFTMPQAQYDALIKLVRQLMAQYNVTEVFAHQDVTYTDCPGNWDFDKFKTDLAEEKKMFENLVCYGGFDFGAAQLLADKLHAPLVHVDNVTDDLWACAKNKFKVGGSEFRDAKVISGSDRFATMQAVLNL